MLLPERLELLHHLGVSRPMGISHHRELQPESPFQDPRGVMRWGPDGVALKDSNDLTRDEAVCISEVSQTVSAGGGTLKVKLHDKLRALELLGKHVGMFAEKVQVSGSGGGPIQTVSMTADEFSKVAAEIAGRI